MTNHFGLVNPENLPGLRKLRTMTQEDCPCDRLIEYEVDDPTRGIEARRRFARECLDCGFVDVGRYVRPATKPDPDH